MPPAHLGVDFGTSHTVAVLRRSDGRVEALMFGGTALLPSGVAAGRDGVLTVGADAAHTARTDPASFEPHPKRRIDDGTVLLGEREFAVEDLFAAVLGEVRRRCAEVARAVPETVTLTHPAAWGPRRRRILRSAAAKAGFPEARLLPEPVAAAAYYTRELGHEVPVGAAVVVHDFGGGTFDAAVVRRTVAGFEVLAVDGLDDLGGVDVDEALMQHLRSQYGDPDVWTRLLGPSTSADRRNARILREDVRSAKELLSGRTTADLHIPVLDKDVHVTRGELERITAPLLARAVEVTSAVVAESGVPAGAVTGVFLVGGGSRMPLAATLLHRELGRAPVIADHIEQVVAHGAILDDGREAPPPQVPEPPAPVYRPTAAPPPPPRPVAANPQRPTVLNVLAIVVFLQIVAAVLQVGGDPSLSVVTGVLLLASSAFAWWRRPLSRLLLVVGQLAYLGVQLAVLVFAADADWTALALQLPLLAAGVAGAELAASQASADWYRVPVGPSFRWKASVRRIVVAVTAFACLVTAVAVNQDAPWSLGSGADPAKLRLTATFGSETAYVDLATGGEIAVGARTDGRIDVIRPDLGAVTETYEVGSGPITAVALSEVAGQAVAVVGSAGSARVVALDSGTELCEIKASGHFADLAIATSEGAPVVVSGRSGGLGVWRVDGCVSRWQFDIPSNADGEIGVVTDGDSPAAVFAEAGGLTHGFDLSTGATTGGKVSLTGRPTLATTADGALVMALGTRLSAWDTATGGERTGVDLAADVRDGSLAVLRSGERLLAATVDAEGTLRVCDLDSGEEAGEYQFGLTESAPLLGFTDDDGDPMLVVAAGGQVAVFRLP